MAEEEKSKKGIGAGGWVLIAGGAVALMTTSIGEACIDNPNNIIQIGYENYDNALNTIVGKTITLHPDTYIYTSYDAALFGNNPQQMSFPDEQRIVTRAYYAVNNEYEFVGINEYNYQQHEQEILDNGGRLVVVLTAQTNNLNEPEGFIKADDIDKKIYGPVKK